MGQCNCVCVVACVEVQERHRNRANYAPVHMRAHRRSKKNRTQLQTPIQIIDNDTDYCLYVNDRTTLVDGAPDPSESTAMFYINYYDPEDLTTFWLENAAIGSRPLAADLSNIEHPRIIFVSIFKKFIAHTLASLYARDINGACM